MKKINTPPTFRSRLKIAALAMFVVTLFGAWTQGQAQNVGYRDYSYGSTLTAPSESKPESKLWFNDGIWWGILFNPTLQGTDIYRLDLPTQTWIDTGTPVDDRAQTNGDALWDQASGKLYLVSNIHVDNAQPNNTSSNWGRLYRYTYNSSTKSYALDSGYPVTVTKGREETLVLTKDSNGKLWVTYVEAGKVMINHSNGADNVWGTPTVLPVSAAATTVTTDDIATIISFGGNKIGVFWSNQSTNRDYFAVHPDSNADGTWSTEETAWGNGVNCTGLCADDHLNIKADSAGKIYVAIKTSFTNTTDPFIVLVVRSTAGVWSSATESQHANTNTRGIVLLDEAHDRLYLFVSSNEAGGDIDYKVTTMSNPSFVVTGQGSQFIHNSTDAHLNNATSTKQNLTSASGLVVLAGDDTTHFYEHNYVTLGSGPIITGFSPASGLSGTSVVITGLKFTGANSVKFNGVTASFTVNSDTQITTTVPSSATSGAITVTTSGGTGTSGSAFNVTLPVPTVSSFSPTSGTIGTSVVVTGTNFSGITGVAFNGVPVPSTPPGNFVVNSSTKITTPVPANASTGKISVTNSGGTGTSASTFTVKPAITSLSPASGSIGLPVTINGSGLTGTTSVKFTSNKTATFTVISDTQINTTVPTGTTTGTVTVTTPGGTATSASFTIATRPTITSFTPASGPVGTSVTINGTSFTASPTVSFNGTLAVNPTFNSTTKITATVPAGATTGPITITATGGPATSSTSYLVTPVISSFSPTSGGSGTAVTITGTSFTGANAVNFNGTTAGFSVTDDSHIATTVPSGATNGTLSVTTPGGTATSSGTFNVLPPPTITSFTPAGGAVGTPVTITGNNFGATQGTSTVKFNGIAAAPASPASNWTNTSITVLVPASATIGPITVTTSTGVGTSSTNFFPAPVISSFAPTSGASGTSVAIGGVNFTGATAIAFNGGVATTFNVDSDTSIHATVPATGSTGAISVTAPNGGTGSSASNFTVSPIINSLNPTAGPLGAAVTITGSGFGPTQGTSTVTFGGTSAGLASSWAPTSITVNVPGSLAQNTPYTVIVTVAGVNSTGQVFSVTHPAGSFAPTINSFSPFEGIAGTTVTLTGFDFTGTTAISFNGTATPLLSGATDNQIMVQVPAGATSGPISVTNGAGTTLTATNFTVSSLVRNMTFENGTLVNPTTGADSAGGSNSSSLVDDASSPLKDTYSAHVVGVSDAYLNKTFSPTVDDLYETFYIRVNATHSTAALIAQLTSSGAGTLGEIRVTAANKIQLTRNGTQIGSLGPTLALGTVYRVLLHQKKGTGSNAIIEAYLATGDAPFTTSFASNTADTFTAGVSSLKIGNISASTNTIDLTFDNVQLDSAIPQGQAPPLITSLTPNNGPVGTVVTIAGLHFGASTGAVTFNGVAATPTNWTDTSITVPVPVGATTGNVVVTNTSNVNSNGSPFTVGGTITNISPTSGAIGATVTITGTNLSGATQVTFNGVPAGAPTSNTATQIVVTVPATATTGPIVVTTPNGTASSAPTNFTVVPAPVISGLSSPTGAIGQSITITGTNFGATQVTGSYVTFNGTLATVSPANWSDTSIVVPVPAGATTGNVVVSAAGVASNGISFTVIPNITNVSPNAAAVGATVTITGTSFGAAPGGSTITFNGTTATAGSWSDTSISVPVPLGASSGNIVVTVNSQASNGFSFTVVPPPSITNLSASSGYAGSSVTITGTNFGANQSSSTVTFNGATATVNTWSDTSLAVTVPPAATTGNVVVTVGGVASNGISFTVLPNILGVSPSAGPANTVVTINGTRFGTPQGASTVTFNGTLAAAASNWSDSSIVVAVPVGATPGIGSVVVTVGGQPSNAFTFNVIAPPSISNVSPNAGYSGQAVTVQGANFGAAQGSSTVTFNGVVAQLNGAWTDTSIPVFVPSGLSLGSAPVVVTVSNQASGSSPFTVVQNVTMPTVTSFAPTSGTNGTVVTISGSGFSGTTAVKFNGTPATTYSVDSDTQITVVVPAGSTTGLISVTNGAGTTPSSTNFTVTLIKFSTFEAGSLTDPATGVSSTTGTGNSIDSVTPLKSLVSAHVNVGNSWLQDTFAGQDDVYASFYLRLNSLPAAAVRIAMFVDGGTTAGNFNLSTAGVLTLRNGTTNITPNSAALVVGQVYRVAIHQKKGTGANAILEGFLVQGDAPFGVPFASTATGTWTTQADTFRVGATINTAVDLTTDNIQIDTTLPLAAPSPSITGFSPTHGTVGATVTISGTNFGATQSGGSVKFNGTTATVNSWSSTSIVATVPANATFGFITVTTAGGTASTSNLTPSQFTVDSGTPSITNLSPTSAAVTAPVTINGANFGSTQGGSTVSFNGVNAQPADFISWSATAITVKVPTGATTGNVVVTVSSNPSNGSAFTVLPTAAITNLSPTSAAVGTPVTITGTGFGNLQNSSTVTFNGTAAQAGDITGWSDTSLTVKVPVGASTGNVVVTVGGAPSNGSAFTVLATPAITNITPNSAAVAGLVTITGTSFGGTQNGSTVSFNGTQAQPADITGWGDASITVKVPTGATTGNVVVTVGGIGSNGFAFTVLPTATISNVSPTSAAVAAPVTITGTNFGATQGNSTVTFNGTAAQPADITGWGASSITVKVPVGASTGNVVVTVGGAPSNGFAFTVLGTPSITNISPNSAAVTAVVTITGTSFGTNQGTSTVSFNGTQAQPSDFTGWGDTSITVKVPAGATTGNVVVTAGGAPSNGFVFTVVPTAVISNVSPSSAAVAGSVTITGSNFGAAQNGSTVTFNGTPALVSDITSWSPSSITVKVPAGASSGNVVVTVGGVGSNGFGFTVLPTATITNLSPTSAAVGTVVTITGTNFGVTQSGSSVTFNGTAAQPGDITGWNTTSITVKVPVGATSGNVVVTVGGAPSNGSPFAVLATPVISNVSPSSAAVTASVVITGSSFGATIGGSSIAFNGQLAQPADISNWSDTSITVKVPSGATTGNVIVTVGGVPSNGFAFTVLPTAIISNVSPLSAAIGAPVTITGSNFGTQSGNSVTFNGTPAQLSDITNWTATSITVKVPVGATSGNVVVTVGGAPSNGVTFTVLTTPSISGVSPGSAGVAVPVTITGTNFGTQPGNSVTFNGTPAQLSDITNWTATSITVKVPVGATSGNVVVTVSGVPSNGFAFTVIPAPSISGFTPISGPTNTQVTINGSNLGSASSVTIAGVAATINANSATQILATVNAVNPAQGLVVVTTAGGTADSSALANQNFTVTVTPPPLPSITSFSPPSGASGTLVTINGVNFTNTNSVTFNGVTAAFSFVSDSQLTATVPAGATTGPISVTNGSGSGNTSSLTPPNFTVTASTRVKDITFESGSLTGTSGFASTTGTVALETGSPIKGVDSMTINGGNSYGTQTYTATDEIFISLYIRMPAVPSSQTRVVRITDGGTSTGAITLETTGKITLRNSTTSIGATTTALVPGTVYRIGIHQKKGTGANAVLEGFLATGDAAFTTPFASSSSLTFTTQADSVQIGSSTGTVANITFDDIRLDTGAMPGPSTPPIASAPNVTGFSPTNGPVGTSVVIAGSNFGASQGTSTVKFGATQAGSITAWNDSSITVTVPAGAVTGAVSVTTAAGTGTSATNFTVGGGATPSITSFNPTSGPIGTSVTITGSNFGASQGGSTVTFNGIQASVDSWADTSITATVPSGATTGAIAVTTGGGTGTSGTNFTVSPIPTVTSFSPTSGLVGASITINGANFTGATTVMFNGTSATTFVVNSDVNISATVPASATTGSISVTTGSGTGSSASSFTVIPPAPTVSGFNPTSGPAGTTQVTITGSNLSNASAVTIAGAAATINSNTATQILATVGAGATGSGPIAVTTNGGSANSTSLPTPNFTVTVAAPPQPVITSFTPTSGASGTVVTINGANFTGTTAVKFNGVAASTFTFVNDSQLTATVPASATTGPISVTNGAGTADSSTLTPPNFTVNVGSRAKDITFESASLTGTSGFASTTGTVALETGSPIKGVDSMTINGGNSYGTQTYTATDEIFISLYIRMPAVPSSQTRVVRITDGGTSTGAITLETTGKITLRNSTTSIGATTTALVPGTVYRIGIHQKKGTGANAVLEGFLATGDAAFTTPFASSSSLTFTTQADSVQIGSSTGTVANITFDDIRLDTGAMPGPSIP